MKLKNIKLLKTLAVTGALGLVAAVPVITATACSSDTSNSGGSSGDNTGGDSSGGGSSNGDQTQTKVTPELSKDINITGALSGIYDGKTNDTNDLIAKAIELDPTIAFTNGADLKDKDLTVKVDGGFPTTSDWTGKAYNTADGKGWNKDTINKTIVYASNLKQMSISSLNDLKKQLDTTKITEILKAAGEKVDEKTTYQVQNMPGLINDDLIHVNVLGTTPAAAGAKTDPTTTNIDLQIPTSDINLDVSNCKISVEANDKINALTNGTTEFTYNIGVDPNTHYVEGPAPSISATDVKDAMKALKELGLTKTDGTTLDNDKIASALGVYNCTFDKATIAEKAASSVALVDSKETPAATSKTYTITLTATLNTNDKYYWTDGTLNARQITFDATFNVTA